MQVTASLGQRAALWRRAVRGPARFARHAAVLAAVVGVAFVARPGTTLSRAAGLLSCLLLVGLAIGYWVLRSRADNARRLVRQVIVPTDRSLGARALRATRLIESSPEGSAAVADRLAHHHLERLIAAADPERVEAAARRRGQRYRTGGLVLSAAIALVLLVARLEVAEGLNVLLAHGKRAPLAMQWTEWLRLEANLPAYLGASERRLSSGSTSILPRGTQVTLRARPLHPGRKLVVSDGRSEVEFVSDGDGGIVAHYAVEDDAELIVAARFGEVLIVEPRSVRIVALPDKAPRVVLEGAPRTVPLSEMDRLELRWSAIDDHGLEQVDLVLRSGNHEERRLLSRFDAEPGWQGGGYALSPSDAFLRLLYLPAQVTIEARDNDPVEGSKWGTSEAIEIVPTAVGEAEASRYLALVHARDRFVDVLAAADPAGAASDRSDFERRLKAAVAGFRQDLEGAHGGLSVAPGLKNFALGQLRGVEEHQGEPASFAEPLGELILAFDSALVVLSRRDSMQVARVLSEVAEEAMVGAQLARSAEDVARGASRLDQALFALAAGADHLVNLGALGHDLAGVTRADLGRIRRARAVDDFFHAELAARHLADRLRRPRPSFGSSGAGGVEAGQGGSPRPSDTPSEADQQFDQMARQIAELAREHGKVVEQVDLALSEARSAAEPTSLREEAEQRAAELRDAVDGLPVPGSEPGTPEGDAALAREHAHAMAHGMESLTLEAAVESGRRALSAMETAGGKLFPSSRLAGDLDSAQDELRRQLTWLEQRVAEAKREARERASAALEGSAELERELATTAEGLAERGERGQTPLPAEVTERLRAADQLMRQAARALTEGEGEAGLKLQQEAQRLLERADQGNTQQGGGPDSPSEGDGRSPALSGELPDGETQNAAEQFRRRVLKSLGGGPGGRLAPAIKRYAEGLLR